MDFSKIAAPSALDLSITICPNCGRRTGRGSVLCEICSSTSLNVPVFHQGTPFNGLTVRQAPVIGWSRLRTVWPGPVLLVLVLLALLLAIAKGLGD